MIATYPRIALVAEHHPAFAKSFGTPNLIKTLCSAPNFQFAAIVAADVAGPDPVPGPWDSVPTLSLFRPRSLLPNLSIGLGRLDNLFFRWQRNRVTHFLAKQHIDRLFVLIANNARFAQLAARLSRSIPTDIYIVDDFVEDSHLYHVNRQAARQSLETLLAASDRVFAISPVYAADLQAQYRRPCQFLPLPIPDSTLKTARPVQPKSVESNEIVIHHSGQVHHLYADALARFIVLLSQLSRSTPKKFKLELWGNLSRASLERSLQLDLREVQTDSFSIDLYNAASRTALIAEQQRADFLLLVNSFLPAFEKQVRCSFSSKTSEYLVSGTPILIYAPTYSSLVAYLGQHNAACIVSAEDSDEALAALNKVFSNIGTRGVVDAALKLAHTHHSLDAVFKQIVTPKLGGEVTA